MESDNEVLDEVVVIGYQTIKRKDLTGSVASVSGKTVSVMPVSNVAQAMQGKLPGVNITSQDGRPDAAISIRVRGGGSISQSNEPLILVDGVTVNSLNDIPSDQVESIDVLKDASSTAIYGARGANGVILVTTKGAKEGKFLFLIMVMLNLIHRLNIWQHWILMIIYRLFGEMQLLVAMHIVYHSKNCMASVIILVVIQEV